MSLATQAYIYGQYDERQRLQAINNAAAKRARDFKTAWIDAHIEDVIRSKKRSDLERKSRCDWTSILMRYYELNDIKAPDIETVRRVVYEFNGF